MKSKLTYLVVLIAVAVLYTGCGSDTIINNYGPPDPGYTVDSLIFSYDSLTSDGDTTSLPYPSGITSSMQGFKFTYELSCNTDSAVFSYLFINGGLDTIFYQQIHRGMTSCNGQFEYLIDARNWTSAPHYLNSIYDYGHIAGERITIRRFKIYVITYTQ